MPLRLRGRPVAAALTTVTGQDTYYQIWFGHRIAYVRAADVQLH